jgi:putative membrane protein
VYLALGLVFGLVNAIVKPVVKMIALPLYIITLGLFTLVVNALMLMLTGWLSEHSQYGLRVDSFGTAVIGALIISVVSIVLSLVIPGARKGSAHRAPARSRR